MNIAQYVIALSCALAISFWVMADDHQTAKKDLKTPSAFKHLGKGEAFSKAVFTELGKVIQHPRCVNCHAVEAPLQGENFAEHKPPVVRGAGGIGVPGMMCMSCHGAENVQVEDDWAMPGHSPWKMAPIEQVWHKQTLKDICAQIKNPATNGGMSFDDLIHHMAKDGLVGWGWHPGKGREPVPGTQKIAGQLTKAWIDSGAHCPTG